MASRFSGSSGNGSGNGSGGASRSALRTTGRKWGRLSAAFLAAVTIPFITAGPAAASPDRNHPLPHPPIHGNYLKLKVYSDQDDTARESRTTAPLRQTLLLCPPLGHHPGETHPDPAAACAALAAVDGSLGELPGAPARACPMIYQPVRAESTGRWNGRTVLFTGVYSNDCVLRGSLSPVFDF